MKILVIGGSYFLGRWFVQIAHKDHEITVLNRGNVRVSLDGVRELVCDRHDTDRLTELALDKDRYDAVVDFCAYDKDDIRIILEHMDTDRLKKYIFISTVDVYAGRGKGPISEDSPLVSNFAQGAAGTYIAGKAALEDELVCECDRFGINPVSVRPAVLYGPLNYAPREGMYFDWIQQAGQVLHPADADGYWQMVYVKDAAVGIMKLCELGDMIDRAYNFCTADLVTYDSFEQALRECGCEFDRVDVSVSEVLAKNIPLPFPLREEESAVYSSAAFEDLVTDLTDLVTGLKRCRELR